MYKFETHCHTSEVSQCGKVPARKVVKSYIDAGYSGIVITDHFNRHTFLNKPNLRLNEVADFYLSGYRAAIEAAKGKLTVLLGMELTFYDDSNDYLVYGVTEKFVKRYPNIMDMGIERFTDLAHENGMVVFSAHPFRNNMTIINPSIVDGVEVYNANERHDSRNDIARMWAQKYNKAMSSGSDYHQVQDVARGGIITKNPIITSENLIEALMGNEKQLIEE